MSRRKIVLAVAALLTVIAVSDCGTFALFSDIEASMGNTFTGWTLSRWTWTTADDFNNRATGSYVDTATIPGDVFLEREIVAQYIYAFQGGNSDAFHRYDVASETWDTVTPAPGNVTEGACLVFDQTRYIYALQGGSDAFWRFDTILNIWTELEDAPGIVGSGADLAYDDGVLYALQGGGGGVAPACGSMT